MDEVNICFLNSYYSDFGYKTHVPHFGDKLSIYTTYAIRL